MMIRQLKNDNSTAGELWYSIWSIIRELLIKTHRPV